MSWYAKAAGNAPDAFAEVKRQLHRVSVWTDAEGKARTDPGGPPAGVDQVLDILATLITSGSIVVDTWGHIDQGTGNVRFGIEQLTIALPSAGGGDGGA